jgi:hypothetical protein
VFVVTWHKGAVIRAFLRAVVGAPALAEAPRVVHAEPSPRQRVDVGEAGKVRVHAGDERELAPEELLGQTELPARDARRARSAERA